MAAAVEDDWDASFFGVEPNAQIGYDSAHEAGNEVEVVVAERPQILVENGYVESLVDAELTLFQGEPPIPRFQLMGDNTKTYPNPLELWKAKQSRFPVLSLLARKSLCIPATSAPSERLFSSAGLTISNERACFLIMQRSLCFCMRIWGWPIGIERNMVFHFCSW